MPQWNSSLRYMSGVQGGWADSAGSLCRGDINRKQELALQDEPPWLKLFPNSKWTTKSFPALMEL